jgi:GWxTD domain-containing protein
MARELECYTDNGNSGMRVPRRLLRRTLPYLLICCAFLIALGSAALAATHPQVPARYKKWLQQDAAYIIANEEKKAFLQLTSDLERDQFIDHFWEVRNPTPGAPTNPYKEEHYARLEFAISHFSTSRAEDGWQTDMGRVYITLGPPEQKARYVVQGGVRGMEIWFYSSGHPALPPFFSVIFYEKDPGDFRLYSPYVDGPQKLVTGIQAEQGRVAAVQQIDRILGREVALTTLSLIPGEPVNINTAESTLQSDLMLGTIKDLANNPFSLEELRTRRALVEEVSHRVVLPNELLNALCVPLRDGSGNVRLHYALRLSQPEDFAVAQADDQYYYSLEVLVRVLGADGKEIFTRRRKIAKYLSKADFDLVKGQPVAYEGWLPLAPGKYKVDFQFTSVLGKTTFTAQQDVTVPQIGAQDVFITDPVPFFQAAAVDPSQADVLPFTAGGVRFRPYVAKELALVPGQELKFFYQVWRSPLAPGNSVDKFPLDYAYGMPSFSGSAHTIHDELPRDQFDPNGSVVNGKKIPTTDLSPGSYRLVVSLTDPQNQQKRFSALHFNIVSDKSSGSDSWWIDDDGLAEYLTSGQANVDRGVIYIASGNTKAAAGEFQNALRRNPANETARARLIDYYYQQHDFAKVTELFSQAAMNSDTGESTILHAADSFDRTGNPQKAATLLESVLNDRSPSGALYLALASYYDHLGKSDRAEALRAKGRSLITATAGTANP